MNLQYSTVQSSFFSVGENEHLKLMLRVRNLSLVSVNTGVQWFLVISLLASLVFSAERDAVDNKSNLKAKI